MAPTALDTGPSDADRLFYEGKVASARFYAREVLPLLSAQRAVLESTDLGVMELDEAASSLPRTPHMSL